MEASASGDLRTDSPMMTSRRSSEEGRPQFMTTIMVAHRKQSPFGPPSLGRSSWKKSWGHEPPGWSSRSLQSPPEPALDTRTNIRDVFSGRAAAAAGGGDDSDWVDEDDDEPSFMGGLGQTGASSSGMLNGGMNLNRGNALFPPTGSASTPLPGSPNTKAMGLPGIRSRGGSSMRDARTDMGRHGKSSPTPLPEEPAESTHLDGLGGARARRQPAGRAGNAFKHAIQEEDEGEEE